MCMNRLKPSSHPQWKKLSLINLWTLKLEFHRILMCYKILVFLIVPKHLEMQKQQQQQQNLKQTNKHSQLLYCIQASSRQDLAWGHRRMMSVLSQHGGLD